MIFGLTDRLVERGHYVDLFSYAGAPEWFAPGARLIPEKDLDDVDMSRYDFVVVSNAVFIPAVLPHLKAARLVFFAQDYESFHHAKDSKYEQFLEDSPEFTALYQLPVPIICTSRPIQRLIRERIGRDAYLMEPGINKANFTSAHHRTAREERRVLFVGNYLMPYKGMTDGLDALEMLSREVQIALVLITQEERGRSLFDRYSFQKEIHFCPSESDVPSIIASCDAYCCTSWYEGLGLPALEAFLCGVPVVSTRTIGVDDYGLDGANLLLADANEPHDICARLREVLTDSTLAARLVNGGYETMRSRYEWDTAVCEFTKAIEDIDMNYSGPGLVDLNAMQDYLDRLESAGFFTPIGVYRSFQKLDARLSVICAALLEGDAMPLHAVELQSVRAALAEHLSIESAQYYAAFKAKYDLCQILLAFGEAPNGAALVSRVLTRDQKMSRTSNDSSLTEIRYSE